MFQASLKILLILAICALPLSACATPDNPPTTPRETFRVFFEQRAIPVEKIEDFAPMFQAIGKRRFALLGESTHGTHEYYAWRDLFSRHLIAEKGFRFVAVEGDWQAIYRLNDYVKHRTSEDIGTVMESLTRWPRWMWANAEFAAFLEWLRTHNAPLPESERAGVFGLDMQDPEDSMAAVLAWFEHHDPDNLQTVQTAYDAVRTYPEGFRGYARNLAQGGERLDEELAIAVGLLRDRMADDATDKTLWATKQNALAVKRAEAQYRAMLFEGPHAWNARATFMHEAFLRLAERHGPNSRGIVWAHNTHVGDAQATDMVNRGQVNIGQLLRQSEGADQVYIIGFATSEGTVIAAPAWGAPMQQMHILPPREGSYEAILRASGLTQAVLLFDESARREHLVSPFIQRAIGVVYRPPGEAYVPTILTVRYDALVYIDQTRALSPLP